MNDNPLWSPGEPQKQSANLRAFTDFLSDQYGISHNQYQPLHEWSIRNKPAFWNAIWAFCHVIGEKLDDDPVTTSDDILEAKWFPSARLNFAENLLQGDNSATAIIDFNEYGLRKTLTYRQLRESVAKLAGWLKSEGIQKGDVVAGLLPNSHEAVVAMLATTSLGAVWTSCSPDFGPNGIIDRFSQSKPKIVFATNGYFYNGKTVFIDKTVETLKTNLENAGLSFTLVNVSYVGTPTFTSTSKTNDIQDWQEILDRSRSMPLQFERVGFDHPLYIMYSSGTTGIPKCIVHGVGGTLLQHVKELSLHTNLKSEDVIFYYTTCGWMMWNWLVSALATRATIVIYDGSPFYPSDDTLFSAIDRFKINVFGAGAKFYSALHSKQLEPATTHNLSSLTSCLSTGSPLSPESFEYIYTHIKSDICLSSISGGTDIISCFVLGNPTQPVFNGEIQSIGLGMDVRILDDDGNELSVGKGQLSCCSAFPSRPIYFLNDPDREKYRSAYFENDRKIWMHGDYGELTTHESFPDYRGMIIHGRSDAVLNPGGVRIGTAEIYRQVEKVPEVEDSIAVSQNWKSDVRIILFVKLKPGVSLDDRLIEAVKDVIRKNTTVRHVPAKIIVVPDIPRTISGKITEIAVRQIIHGETVKNTDALANPEALDFFKNIAELET